MTDARRALCCLTLFAALASGCAGRQGFSIATGDRTFAPYAGPVQVTSGAVPADATEVGYVEAQGAALIENAMPEFVARVQELGGNFARLDQWSTRHEMVTRPVMQSYSCGSPRFPMTCTRTVMQTYELATVVLAGRAFRRGLGP
ncbi:MAG: hypothetical protein JNK72_03510 [Myxococcales bacterium]|nr:hypothetical protein [Myxococcales bacterium]